MTKTKKLALLAALTAVALTIFVAEAQIPPVVPVPGVKLGLANIVTLVTMALLGRREAGAVLVVRLILGSAFAGGFSGLMFSAAGGAAHQGLSREADVGGQRPRGAGAQRGPARRGGMGVRLGVHALLRHRARRGRRHHRRVHRLRRHVPDQSGQKARQMNFLHGSVYNLVLKAGGLCVIMLRLYA